jgi:hypothetical protein
MHAHDIGHGESNEIGGALAPSLLRVGRTRRYYLQYLPRVEKRPVNDVVLRHKLYIIIGTINSFVQLLTDLLRNTTSTDLPVNAWQLGCVGLKLDFRRAQAYDSGSSLFLSTSFKTQSSPSSWSIMLAPLQ